MEIFTEELSLTSLNRQQAFNWMKKHMPEALEMMREGKKIGLTFKQPYNLKLGEKNEQT